MVKRCDGKLVIPCNDCKNHIDKVADLKSSYEINMTEIKGDIKYIKEKLDANSDMIQKVIDNKADRQEVYDLKKAFDEDKNKNNTLIMSFLVAIVFILLGIAGYLISSHWIN